MYRDDCFPFAPIRRRVTTLSVPAKRLSDVCVVILNRVAAPPAAPARSVAGASPLTQSSWWKNTGRAFASSRFSTSTECRCQSDPTPPPSCETVSVASSPTSTSATTKTSSAFLSKLLASLSNARVAVATDPSAFASLTLTLASVPAHRTSDVRTVTRYDASLGGSLPAGASATRLWNLGGLVFPIQQSAGKVTVSPVLRLNARSSATCQLGSPMIWDSSWPRTT